MSMEPKLALVVEDDIIQRVSLSDTLRNWGIDVIECETAEAGELIVGRIGVELSFLITDVNLAGRATGLELAEFARARLPNLKIIVVSGERKTTVPPGVCFLTKPWLPSEMQRLTAV